MYWFEKLIPGCCNNRMRKQGNSEIRQSIALPEIQVAIHNERALSLTNETESPKKLKLKNFSRRSTNFTADTFNEVIIQDREVLLNCNNCGLEATGYCPCCPNIRFCLDCFEKSHQRLRGLHRLINYQQNLCPSQRQLENLIKIKKFM